jgi:hypothetical protein
VTQLFIPVVDTDSDVLSGMLTYAKAGLYIAPISPRDRKNPGSVLGKGWQHKTSRDLETLVEWFAGTSYLGAIHAGRSGLCVPDVDHPERIPAVLADAITQRRPPYQSSRPDQPGRGHYLFGQPHGRMIGNRTGELGKGWGEIRGKNGVFVVCPSPHQDEANGARYEWLQTGLVPEMTPELAAALPDATDTADAVSDAEVARFIAEHAEAKNPALLKAVLAQFDDLVKKNSSRHEALVSCGCWAAREAMAGMYSAGTAFELLIERFVTAMATKRDSTDRTLNRGPAVAEATGAMAWAVGQAELGGVDAARARVPAPRILSRGNGPHYIQNPAGAVGSGVSECNEGQSRGEWDSPTPLPGRTDPIPTDTLGAVLQPLVESIGDCLQVPTDLPINLALPLITAAAKGGWRAEVEPGWIEPVCIATLSALPSGERKSPVLRLLDSALRSYERDAQIRDKPTIAQLVAKKKLAEGRVEKARKDALSGLDEGKKEQRYFDLARELEEIEIPALPRWLVDDVTVEKAVSLLAEQGAIASVSSEPGLFGVLAGRYSAGTPNIEWLLKATSGETITVDRIGRPAEHVENPSLSIASCIQPGRLVELGTVKAFRESGLLARQFYVVPTSAVGHRNKPRQVDPDLLARWDTAITDLAAASEKRRDQQTLLRLTEDGRSVLEQFRSEIEPGLHPDHGRFASVADWMNKLPGGAVRIAAALTLIGDPDATEIEALTMANAIRIAKAYISHTIAAFGMIRPNSELHAQAKQVLAVIRRLATEAGTGLATRREVHQKLRDRSWAETSDTLDAPLGLLIEYGHVRPVELPKGKPGRPSPAYELHPSYLPEKALNTPRTPEAA